MKKFSSKTPEAATGRRAAAPDRRSGIRKGALARHNSGEGMESVIAVMDRQMELKRQLRPAVLPDKKTRS